MREAHLWKVEIFHPYLSITCQIRHKNENRKKLLVDPKQTVRWRGVGRGGRASVTVKANLQFCKPFLQLAPTWDGSDQMMLVRLPPPPPPSPSRRYSQWQSQKVAQREGQSHAPEKQPILYTITRQEMGFTDRPRNIRNLGKPIPPIRKYCTSDLVLHYSSQILGYKQKCRFKPL